MFSPLFAVSQNPIVEEIDTYAEVSTSRNFGGTGLGLVLTRRYFQMMGGDGWEATRRLKANPATRHIPVIALTARAMSSDRKKAVEAGCDDYETKPIDLPRLLAEIEGLLN